MSYLSVVLAREISHMQALCDIYENKLKYLPKGSIHIRVRNDNEYYYLSYRKEGKVKSDYIGKSETAVIPLREQLERRKSIEGLLKGMKTELHRMYRALGKVK